jgi:hypothetical protein
MISHQDKIIFVHINKTGGTSIEKAFGSKRDFSISDQIIPKDIIDQVGMQVWADYYTFAMIRNPWDRFISEYFFRKTSPLCPPRVALTSKMSFKEFVLDRYEAMHNPSTAKSELIRFQSQILWLLDQRGNLMVDFIGCFDFLQESFDAIKPNSRMKLPHENKTDHKYYSEYYDEESMNLVRKLHLEDIEAFNYKFGESLPDMPVAPDKFPYRGWNIMPARMFL